MSGITAGGGQRSLPDLISSHFFSLFFSLFKNAPLN